MHKLKASMFFKKTFQNYSDSSWSSLWIRSIWAWASGKSSLILTMVRTFPTMSDLKGRTSLVVCRVRPIQIRTVVGSKMFNLKTPLISLPICGRRWMVPDFYSWANHDNAQLWLWDYFLSGKTSTYYFCVMCVINNG